MRWPVILAGGVVAGLVALATCRDDPDVAGDRAPPAVAREGTAPPARAPVRRRAAPVQEAPEAEPTVAAAAPSFAPFSLGGGPLLVRRVDPWDTSVLEPEGDGAWHDLTGASAGAPVARLGAGRLLLRGESGGAYSVADEPFELDDSQRGPTIAESPAPAIADVARGTVAPAFPDRAVRVVAVAEDRVVALDVATRELVRSDPDGAVAVLGVRDVAAVWAVSSAHAFVTTTSSPRLLRVPFDGGRATELPVEMTREQTGGIAPSPSGRRLAVVGPPWVRLDGGDQPPILRVLDCDTGAELWRIADVEIRVSMWSSGMPRFSVTWPDDARLRFSETFRRDPAADSVRDESWGQRWVEVSATTGARLREVPYAERLRLSHTAPPTTPDLSPPESRERRGLFRVAFDQVWFGDDTDPAACAHWRPGGDPGGLVAVDPTGRWAVVCTTEDGAQVVVLLDGRTRERRVVHQGDLLDLGWTVR